MWDPETKSAALVSIDGGDDLTKERSSDGNFLDQLFASSSSSSSSSRSRTGIGRFAVSSAQDTSMSPGMRYLEALIRSSSASDLQSLLRSVPKYQLSQKVTDVLTLKSALLKTLAASLIREPNLYLETDRTRIELRAMVETLLPYDPEFVLKAALYTRQDLNIRITTNYLLALAGNYIETRPYLSKYFAFATRLPTDWLAVMGLYASLENRTTPGKGYPAALRRALAGKFASFDAHQLAKYKSARSVPKRAPGKSLSLVDAVRMLHISSPAANIMALLGKKYPASILEFASSGLPGSYEPDMAGKRMKLATAITWETQVSELGNVASTWEGLMDARKLPFMAMLRNLRNMLEAGISFRHHSIILSKLATEHVVINSRQFPFRFFSAYDAVKSVIPSLERIALQRRSLARLLREGTASESELGKAARELRKLPNPENPPTEELITRYCDALDEAVKIATTHNVKPIYGSTLVLVNVGSASSRSHAPGARSMGSSVRSVRDLGVLMGLMCKHVAEDCELVLYAGPNGDILPAQLQEGTILSNMASTLAAADAGLDTHAPSSLPPMSFLESLLRTSTKIDALVILDAVDDVASLTLSSPTCSIPSIQSFLDKYREEVHSDLLFVSVDLSGSRVSISESAHPNDVYVAGFSGAILSFIAQRGDANQLQYVDQIDVIKNLPPKVGGCVPQPKAKKKKRRKKKKKNGQAQGGAPSAAAAAAAAADTTPEGDSVKEEEAEEGRLPGTWTTARVFISSTFRDFHAERDILSRVVFPQLRDRAAALKVHVDEVDLRWGVNEADLEEAHVARVCLEEVDRCRPFFVGLLGSRYGNVVSDDYSSVFPQEPRFDWLAEYPEGRSVTELEMVYGALANPEGSYGLFYLRDEEPFLASLETYLAGAGPDLDVDALRADFVEQTPSAAAKLNALRARVRSQANFYQYTAGFGGLVDNKPGASNLDDFASRVLEDLWKAFVDRYGPADDDKTGSKSVAPMAQEMAYHQAFAAAKTRTFLGRDDLVSSLVDKVLAPQMPVNKLMGVVGPHGMGKSALLARVAAGVVSRIAARNAQAIQSIMDSQADASSSPTQEEEGEVAVEYAQVLPLVVTHFVGASPESNSLQEMLVRIASEITLHFQMVDAGREIEAAGTDTLAVRMAFERVLEEVAAKGGVVILILDGMDGFSETGGMTGIHALDWLPVHLPVKVLMSATETSDAGVALSERGPDAVEVFTLGQLEYDERRTVIRALLGRYRKRLDETPFNNQLQELTSKRESGSPLYLVLACEELRVFGVYESLGSKLRNLGGSVQALLVQLLDRLEAEHGADLVGRTLAYMCVSRGGLLESELGALLAPAPRSSWAALVHSLRPYLAGFDTGVPSPVLAFFHGSLEDAVATRYLSTAEAAEEAHLGLAEYFESTLARAGREFMAGQGVTDELTRAGSELVYHLVMAGSSEALGRVLGSLAFVYARAVTGTLRALSQDYALVLKTGFTGREVEVVRDFEHFVSSTAHVLSASPKSLLQEAGNTPYASAVSRAASSVVRVSESSPSTSWLDVLPDDVVDGPRLAWINKPEVGDAMLRTLTGSTDAVTAVAVSPDSKVIATGSRDTLIRVYETGTGEELVVLRGHTNWVSAVAFLPEGKSVVSGSFDSTVRVWDLGTGEVVASHKRHRRRVTAVDVSFDGRKVVSGSWDATVIVWSIAAQKVIYSLSGHRGPVSSVSFSPDGFWVASGSWDTSVRVWNARRGQGSLVLEGHTQSVRDVAFSPDSQQVASVSVDGTLKLWSGLSGSLIASYGAPGSGPINSVSYSGDGGSLVTGAADGSSTVWAAKPGRMIEATRVMNPGEGRGLTCLARSVGGNAVSPMVVGTGEGTVVSVGPAGRVCVYGDGVHGSGVVTAVAMVEVTNGVVVVSADSMGVVAVWPTGSPDDTPYVIENVHVGGVATLASCVGGSGVRGLFVSGGEDTTPKVWLAGRGEARVVATLPKHDAAVSCAALAWHGRGVATVGRDNRMIVSFLVPGKGGRETRQISSQIVARDWVSSLAWSGDGSKLATASWDASVSIWNASTVASGRVQTELEQVYHIEVGNVALESVVFSPDGGRLAVGDAVGDLSVWDLGVGRAGAGAPEEETRIVSAAEGRITALLWEDRVEHGPVVSLAGDDGVVASYAVFEGDKLAEVTHGGDVGCVAYVPEQSVFVSASTDKMVKVWAAEDGGGDGGASGSQHDAAVVSVASLGEDKVVSCASDGSVRVWVVGEKSLGLVGSVQVGKDGYSASCVVAGPVLDGVATGVAAAHDGTCVVFSRETLETVVELRGIHDNTVSAMDVNKRGELASGSWDGTLQVHALSSSGVGREELRLQLGDWVTAVAWSPDGTCVAAGTSAGRLVVMDVVKGVREVDVGGCGWVKGVVWGKGGVLYAGGNSGVLYSWQRGGGGVVEVGGLGVGIVGLAAAGGRGRVVVGCADQRVVVVRGGEGRVEVEVEVWLGFGCGGLGVGRGGRRVLVGDEGGGVRVYE